MAGESNNAFPAMFWMKRHDVDRRGRPPALGRALRRVTVGLMDDPLFGISTIRRLGRNLASLVRRTVFLQRAHAAADVSDMIADRGKSKLMTGLEADTPRAY